jgi:hypothetical protein
MGAWTSWLRSRSNSYAAHRYVARCAATIMTLMLAPIEGSGAPTPDVRLSLFEFDLSIELDAQF